MAMSHEVTIGGSGQSLELLKKEFPDLKWVSLAGYDPVYSRKKAMVWIMLKQLPKFIAAIVRERRAVQKYVDANSIDIVISDNRYGCRATNIKSIFITHQSNILMPKRFGWLAPFVRWINGYFMRRFDVCWIPDYPDQHSLAGDLIAFGKSTFHRNVNYLGTLSRFSFKPPDKIDYDILAICSGPEPQRSIFERMLSAQLGNSGMRYILVRGVVGAPHETKKAGFMTSADLESTICRSEMIICRCGYSSVMDMSVMGKKAIFIPTPGQTEQEYLAERLKERGICFSMAQDEFDLMMAMRESEKYSGFKPPPPTDLLENAIRSAVD
jgi:UDP-N-acetylglucosamine transferase subunit ALG13